MDKLYLDSVITDTTDLWHHYVYRQGFLFTAITEPTNVFDAIVIRNPINCDCWTPKFPFSAHSLQEHIDFINHHKIQKALIIAEDISFIRQCPTLKHLQIIPADTAQQDFDYSPLYDMPEIISLSCQVKYGIGKKEITTTIDLSKIRSLKNLDVNDIGHLNYFKTYGAEDICISTLKNFDSLKHMSELTTLKSLTLLQTGIKRLDGIENLINLQSLSLWYNRNLADVSQIIAIAPTLRQLSIENCPKITNFSWLNHLNSLEYLSLEGKNKLPNLDFLQYMPKLKVFCFSMDITDGDITPCLSVPYVSMLKGKKHYNLKDNDLPKNKPTEKFEIL